MIKIGRGVAVMPLLSLLLYSSIETSFGHIGHRGDAIIIATTLFKYWNVIWPYLLMGVELGDETYIDVPLVSLALSPPIFTLIGNTDM